MKIAPRSLSRHAAKLALVSTCLAASGLVQAENHALIMTIDYVGVLPTADGRGSPLPSVNKDGAMAREIAVAMGVPESNIRWYKNGQLSAAGMSAAFTELAGRVKPDDRVFLYYSGHGGQSVNGDGGGRKCSEGMITNDLNQFQEAELGRALNALVAKASQVVMMNDSCFSGGHLSKDAAESSRSMGIGPAVAKTYVPVVSLADRNADYQCGQAVNKSAMSRALSVVERKSTRLLYVAASADNEVSYAYTPGSIATIAWRSCIVDRSADRNRDGIVDGEELRQCSQEFIDAKTSKHQTITLVGESSLPLSFTASAGAGNESVVPQRSLDSLRQSADPSIKVGITVDNPRLKIKQDLLNFSVRTEQSGNLYLLHVSSEGQFYVLFPNKRDDKTFLPAGEHRFPRSNWGIQAQGPAGKGYILAILAEKPLDFTKSFGSDGPFATAEANADAVKALGTVALSGRFGASKLAVIEEVN